MSDDNGVLLGINRHNNSLCVVDLFDTKKNKNANLNLLGTSGAGKSFTMQLLALRMRMRGIQCFILAPIKGHEFRRACNRIGGQFIKIAPGSPHCINIIYTALEKTKKAASSCVVKGIDAMILMSQGYTSSEIGKQMGASANLVCAWVSKARKFLRTRPEIEAIAGHGL